MHLRKSRRDFSFLGCARGEVFLTRKGREKKFLFSYWSADDKTGFNGGDLCSINWGMERQEE